MPSLANPGLRLFLATGSNDRHIIIEIQRYRPVHRSLFTFLQLLLRLSVRTHLSSLFRSSTTCRAAERKSWWSSAQSALTKVPCPRAWPGIRLWPRSTSYLSRPTCTNWNCSMPRPRCAGVCLFSLQPSFFNPWIENMMKYNEFI